MLPTHQILAESSLVAFFIPCLPSLSSKSIHSISCRIRNSQSTVQRHSWNQQASPQLIPWKLAANDRTWFFPWDDLLDERELKRRSVKCKLEKHTIVIVDIVAYLTSMIVVEILKSSNETKRSSSSLLSSPPSSSIVSNKALSHESLFTGFIFPSYGVDTSRYFL